MDLTSEEFDNFVANSVLTILYDAELKIFNTHYYTEFFPELCAGACDVLEK